MPQSFDSNGTGSSIGFGRVFYLLDQMKTEVTDADQSIKTLQTDMKLLVSNFSCYYQYLSLFLIDLELTEIRWLTTLYFSAKKEQRPGSKE